MESIFDNLTLRQIIMRPLLFIFMAVSWCAHAQRMVPTYNSNAIPVFEHKADSLAYALILNTIRELSKELESRSTEHRLDSLQKLESDLKRRIIGYRYIYRSTRSFTSLADLRENRVKPEDVTQLSIADARATSLPSEVFRCPNLKELELVNTRIRSLPGGLEKLKALHSIYVYSNSGHRLRLSRNTRVRQLVLQGMTQQNLPRNYKRFVSLDSLELSRNIGLREFPRISRNQQLVKLNLMENLITLKELRRGNQSLRDLNLARNKITEVPAVIGKFPALRKLILNANQITRIDPAMAQLKQLENLGLYQNALTSIPQGIMMLTNLRMVDLYYNKLTQVDPEIAGLKNLRILYLSYNGLSELPESIGQLSNLQELYVHDNKLKSIPAGINKLAGLRVLRINNNFLSSLPDSLSALQQLENLDVSRNFLYHFPENWARLPRLQVLGLMNNPWDDKAALERIAEGLRQKGVTCLFSAN